MVEENEGAGAEAVAEAPVVDERIEKIARVCHEANRAWCVVLGDDSQVSWDEAPEWQQDSAREGVRLGLQGLGPADLHQSWMQSKLDDGWVYGPVKDADAKTHPCLVPYSELVAEQRVKDSLFHAVVNALG